MVTNHARIQKFSSGGGGGSMSVWQKKKPPDVFFCFFFAELILQKVNEHVSIFQGYIGSPTFSRWGGGLIFSSGGGGGGIQLLIPYRNPCNLWFSRGGVRTPCPPPSPPLDPHQFAWQFWHITFLLSRSEDGFTWGNHESTGEFWKKL